MTDLTCERCGKQRGPERLTSYKLEVTSKKGDDVDYHRPSLFWFTICDDCSGPFLDVFTESLVRASLPPRPQSSG